MIPASATPGLKQRRTSFTGSLRNFAGFPKRKGGVDASAFEDYEDFKLEKNGRRTWNVKVVGEGLLTKNERHPYLKNSTIYKIVHSSFKMSFTAFFLWLFGLFMTANLSFALLFWLHARSHPNCIDPNKNSDGAFADCLYLSLHTFSTIGYGALAPTCAYEQFIATLEMFFGLLSTAIATALLFTKFTNEIHSARICFSDKCIIRYAFPHDFPILEFRLANACGVEGEIVDAQLEALLVVDVHTVKHGQIKNERMYLPVKLESNKHPMFGKF